MTRVRAALSVIDEKLSKNLFNARQEGFLPVVGFYLFRVLFIVSAGVLSSAFFAVMSGLSSSFGVSQVILVLAVAAILKKIPAALVLLSTLLEAIKGKMRL